jgi:hypothetical protein
VIHHGSLGTAGGLSLAKGDQHAGQLHRDQRSLLHDDAAEMLDPELLVDFDVLDVQMHVAIRDAGRVGRRELRARGRDDRERQD